MDMPVGEWIIGTVDDGIVEVIIDGKVYKHPSDEFTLLQGEQTERGDIARSLAHDMPTISGHNVPADDSTGTSELEYVETPKKKKKKKSKKKKAAVGQEKPKLVVIGNEQQGSPAVYGLGIPNLFRLPADADGVLPTIDEAEEEEDPIKGQDQPSKKIKKRIRQKKKDETTMEEVRPGEFSGSRGGEIGVYLSENDLRPGETLIGRYVEVWKSYSDFKPKDVSHLMDLCIESNDLVLKAMKTLSKEDLRKFNSAIEDDGFKRKTVAELLDEIRVFTSQIPNKRLFFPLSTKERVDAYNHHNLISYSKPVAAMKPDPEATRFLPEGSKMSPREVIFAQTHTGIVDFSKGFHKGPYHDYGRGYLDEYGQPFVVKRDSDYADSTTDRQSTADATPGGSIGSALSDQGAAVDSDDFSDAPQPKSFELASTTPEINSDIIEGLIEPDRSPPSLAATKKKIAGIFAPFIDSDKQASEKKFEDQSIGDHKMIATQVALPLPVLPAGWTAEKDFKAVGTLSPATERSIEPVGPHFLAHARRARHKRTFSEDDRIQAQHVVKKVEEEDAGEISETEDPSMLLRDAKDWKQQDHYAVLGLSKHRYKASEEQIKRAHRKKVLRHHPDKKAAAGATEDDSFFKCIQKATEVLLDPTKRRQFDSVDERADVDPPSKKQTQKGNFYKLWSPVFKAEGRFSKTQPVPKFGDENSTKEDVENFYNFWYNFDSWRSFEYQDEDVPDDNENRDQKRHMERKNNNARKKKKVEDNARLRKILDDACAMDERIKKFRNEANATKNKKKTDREAAEKKAAEDAKAKKEADEAAAKIAEEAAKVDRDQGKKAKEAAKNAVKKNKRVLKGSVKDANYFVAGDAPAAAIDGVLNDVELIQGKIDADEIAALAGKLNGLKVADDIKGVWTTEVKRLVDAGKIKEGDVKTIV